MSRMNWNRPSFRRPPRDDFNPLERAAAKAERSWAGGAFVGIDLASGRDRTVEIEGTRRNGVLHVEKIRETIHGPSEREAIEQLRAVTRATVHCDGCCDPNPGRGGWGLLVDSHSVPRIELCGGDRQTTNNRMELTAAITALRVLPAQCVVLVITDSQYVVKGASAWIASWRRKGFKRKGADIPNADLWRTLDALATGRSVSWKWVKGHNGHRDNDRADALADIGRRQG